ncbi:MAG: filamentous hemagglutinin N-terminal domain-containing protein [Cyanobacteriota bacterium]
MSRKSLSSAIALMLTGWTLGDRAFGRPIADNSLGTESSRVESLSEVDFQIHGGAQRGRNLFHSLRRLDIERGGSVFFVPDADVRTILTRVTGDRPSDIRGTLGVVGNANLILMNPNGILFGRNARLHVAGSFLGTTAHALAFGNQGVFSASPALPIEVPAALTINPSALLYQQIAPASIAVHSRHPRRREDSSFSSFIGLQVGDAQSLLLAGGEVTVNGGILSALGGAVELGGLSQPGRVGLQWEQAGRSFPSRPRLRWSPAASLADVRVVNGGQIITTVLNPAILEPGGIVIAARRFTAQNARFLAGSSGANAGTISFVANEQIDLQDIFAIATDATNGNSGDITFSAPNITLSNTQVSFNTQIAGNAGNLRILASDTLLLRNSTQIRSEVNGRGNSGSIILRAGRYLGIDNNTGIDLMTGDGRFGSLEIVSGGDLTLDNRSSLSAQTGGSGSAGDVTLRAAGSIVIRGASQIDSSSFADIRQPDLFGNAGSIRLRASDILLDQSRIATVVSVPQGQGGDVWIEGRSLILRNGSRISSRADIDERLGGSNGGNISIHADVIAAVASENSDIDASAVDGQGGRVDLTTQGIFGITFRPTPTNLSDITVNSRFGLDGTVTINGLTVDPSQGLTDLPSQPVDVSRLIAQGCGTAGTAIALAQREFIVSGRGGLPAAPGDVRESEAIATAWAGQGLGSREQGAGVSFNTPTSLHPAAPSPHHPTIPPSLTEAQGWVRDESGQVRLVAEVPVAASSPIAAVACGEGRSPTRQ